MKMSPEKVLTLLNNHQIDELKAYALDALEAEKAHQKGGASEVARRNAAIRYIKGIGKITKNESLHGVWYEDGYQYFSNSYSVFRFNEGHHINGLPEISSTCQKFNAARVFDIEYLTAENTEWITQTALKLEIAKWRVDGKLDILCSIKVGLSYYDMRLLLDSLQILGVESADIKQFGEIKPGLITLEGRSALVYSIKMEN